MTIIAGVLLALLQMSSVATPTAQLLADIANPLEGTEISIGEVQGSWVASLELMNVTVTRTDSATGERLEMAHVDTLSARYDLSDLTSGQLTLRTIRVAGPRATLRQAADSTWDWIRVLPPPSTDTTTSSFIVRVEDAVISRGSASAQFYTPGSDAAATGSTQPDSTASIDDLYVSLPLLESNAALGGLGLRARLDTLGLRARAPGDTSQLTFGTRLDLSPSRLQLDTLALDSPRSRVTGEGVARLPSGLNDVLSDVNLQLSARPLSFLDLVPLLPAANLDPAEEIDGLLQLTGSGDELQARLDATFQDGGEVDIRSSFTPRIEAPKAETAGGFFSRRAEANAPAAPSLRYAVDARVDNLTTSLIGPRDSLTNRINAQLQADLSGESLSELSGSLTATVGDTRYGVTRADSVRVQANLNQGSTTYTLAGTINGAAIDGSGRAEPFADIPTYELAASFRNLDAEAFGAAGFPTQMNGRLTLDGRGTSASDLRASTQLSLEPSVVNDLSIRTGEARVTLVPDSTTGRIDITTPNGRFLVVGMTELDGSERFRVDTARVDNIDIAGLMADTTDSRLQLTGRATGQGFDPATMQLDGLVNIADSYYGTVRLDSLRSEVSLTRGTLSAMLRTTVNEGQIALTASGRPFDSPLAVTVENGRFRRIDLGKWSEGESATSDLNGSFSASVEGGQDLSDLATMTASATVELDSSRINNETIRSAAVNGSLTRGTVEADARLTLPSGTSTVVATARPFAEIPEIRITDGTIRGVNVGRLAAVDGLDTDLSGSVTGSAQGTDLASLDGRATIQFADSRINRAPLDQARLTLRIQNGTAQMQLRSLLAGGALSADGSFAIDSLQTAAAASDDRRTPDVSGADSTETDLGPPRRTRPDSDANQTRVQLAVEAATLDLAALAGTDSTAAALDSLRWSFDGSGETLATLTAKTEFTARGITAADLNVRSVDFRGRLDNGLLRVDTLVARSNAARATGGGIIAFLENSDTAPGASETDSEPEESETELDESDFRFTAVATNLPALRALTGAESLDADTASVDGRVYGSPGNLRFGLEGEVRGLVYDNLRLARLTLRAAGNQGDSTLIDRAEATLNANTFTADAVQIDQTSLNVLYDSSRADVRLQTRIDNRRNATIEAELDPRADQQSVTLRAFSATINDNQWELLQEAKFFYGDAYRIRGLLLYSKDQQIAADGRLDPDGEQTLVVDIDNFRVESIADLAGVDGLGGTLNGDISFSGPAGAPKLDGMLMMNVKSNNEDVGDLRVNVGYDSLQLNVDAKLTHTDDTELTARGHLPVDLRLNAPTAVDVTTEPVDFAIRTERLPIDWIDPFLDPQLVRDPSGRLQADIQIGGTIGTPEVGGTAKLRDGSLRIYDLDVSYERATADVSFDGERIVLSNTQVYDQNGGRLTASGFINLAELTVGEYDLDLDAREFVAIDTRAYKDVRIDGDLAVTGTTEEPVVRGNLTVIQGDIFYSETLSEAEAASLATVQLNEQDRRLLEQRFSVRLTEADTTTFDAYQAMEMEMSVNIRRDTWLRSRANPELNIQFTGTLDLEKESGDDARVFGAIDVVPERSTIRQFGQEFRIQEGTLSFNGNPEEPYLNFIAVYEKQSRETNSTEVEISLSAQGRPEDLDLQLSSQPQMDTRNILSYLATGQPADQLLSGGGSTTDLAENLAIGQLTSLAENFATSNVGLDVVRIQYQPDGGSYFVLGRYVTPRFYVAIEQPVAVNQTQQGGSATSSLAPDLTLEYELTDNLLMRAQSRQQSLRFNLLFEYAY